MTRHLFLLALTFLFAAGCGKPTVSAGKPGAGDPGQAAVVGTAHLGNKIEIEGSPIRVEKGKTAVLKVTAKRKDEGSKDAKKETVMYKVTYYQGDIKLAFDTEDTPQQGATGLKFEPAIIPAGQDSALVTVTAAPNAMSGMVKIIGNGDPKIEPGMVWVIITVR